MLRLFTAINFDEATRKKLLAISENLRRSAKHGNFSLIENLHITLVFLGEQNANRLADIEQTIESVSVAPFTLTLNGLGCFKRDGGDIFWVGVQKNGSLKKLYSQLNNGFMEKGFQTETREYKPHLTIAREVILFDHADKVQLSSTPTIEFEVTSVSLMKSERVNGTLVYSEIFKKPLC